MKSTVKLDYLTKEQQRSLIENGYSKIHNKIDDFLWDYFTCGVCYTTVEGSKWKGRECYSAKLQEIFHALGEAFELGNNAPRGGAMGNYIKRTTPRKVLFEKLSSRSVPANKKNKL